MNDSPHDDRSAPPPFRENVVRLSGKTIGKYLWRVVIFTVGLVPISGRIEVVDSPWTFSISSSRFFGYLCIILSISTTLIDLLSRSENIRRRNQRYFRWIAIAIVVGLVLTVLLPII